MKRDGKAAQKHYKPKIYLWYVFESQSITGRRAGSPRLAEKGGGF